MFSSKGLQISLSKKTLILIFIAITPLSCLKFFFFLKETSHLMLSRYGLLNATHDTLRAAMLEGYNALVGA